jgi:hypothetical protein
VAYESIRARLGGKAIRRERREARRPPRRARPVRVPRDPFGPRPGGPTPTQRLTRPKALTPAQAERKAVRIRKREGRRAQAIKRGFEPGATRREFVRARSLTRKYPGAHRKALQGVRLEQDRIPRGRLAFERRYGVAHRVERAPEKSYGPVYRPGDPLEREVEQQVISPLQKRGILPTGPSVGQRIYGEVAKFGLTLVPGGAPVRGVQTGLRAIKAVRAGRGVTQGAARTRLGARLRSVTPRSLSGGGALRTTARTRRAGITERRAVEGLASRGARYAVAGGPHGAAIEEGTRQALQEDPEGVLKRTPSAALASLAGLGSVLAAPVTAAAQGSMEPLRQAGQAQVESVAEFAGFFSGDPEKVKELTLKYGLAPHATAAIPLAVLAKPVRRTRAATARLRGQPRVSTLRARTSTEPPPVLRATEKKRARERSARRLVRGESGFEARVARQADPYTRALAKVPEEKRDLVPFLAGARISRNPAMAQGQAGRIRKRLEKQASESKEPLPDYQLARRIEEDPSLVTDERLWAAIEARGERAEARRPSTITPERARVRAAQEQAFEYGVRTPVQRVRGQAAALLKESRGMESKARRLEGKAKTLRTRASERGKGLSATAKREGDQPTAKTVKRAQRVGLMRQEAARLRADAKALRVGAAQRKTEGKRLAGTVRRGREDFDSPEMRAATESFDRDMGVVREREQLPEPQYVRALNAHALVEDARPGPGLDPTYQAVTPGREKTSTANLLARGLVDRRWEVDVAESVLRPIRLDEKNKIVRSFVDDEHLAIGGKRTFTEAEYAEIIAKGPTEHRQFLRGKRSQVVAVRASEFQRAYDGEYAGDFADLFDDAEISNFRDLPAGERFFLFDREAYTEMRAQLRSVSNAFRAATTINRYQAYAVIGTSPGWLISQFPATLAPSLLSVGPVNLMRAVRRYHSLPEDTKIALETMTEAPYGFGQAATESVHGLRRGLVELEYESIRGLARAGWKQHLRDLPQIIRHIERSYTAGIRRYSILGQNIKELRRSRNAFFRTAESLGRNGERFYDEAWSALREMRDLPFEQQLDWFIKNPKAATRIEKYMLEMLGDWRAITTREQWASAFGFFYPFLRWSIRFTWRHFPQRHPVKASILSYLGLANTAELQRLLGTYPDWTTTLMNAVLYTGKRRSDAKLLSFARFSPGGNALVESGFTGLFNTESLRLLQPTASALYEFATGRDVQTDKPVAGEGVQIDPFTGRLRRVSQATGDPSFGAALSDRAGLALNELLRLSPATRIPFGKALLPEPFKPEGKTIWNKVLPSEKPLVNLPVVAPFTTERSRVSLLGTSVIPVKRQRVLEQLRRLSDQRAYVPAWTERSRWKKMPPGPAKDRFGAHLRWRIEQAKDADERLGLLEKPYMEPGMKSVRWPKQARQSAFAPLGGSSRKRNKPGPAWGEESTRQHKWDKPASNVPDW